MVAHKNRVTKTWSFGILGPIFQKLPRCLHILIKFSVRILPCYLHISGLWVIFFNNFFLPRSKLTAVFVQNIKSSVCVLPFYLHISYRRYFFLQLFLLRSKVTAVFLHKLSRLPFIYYHAICTQVTEGMFFNHFLLWSMLPRCFYTCYQICTLYIIMIFTHMLPCICFSTSFPVRKKCYRGVYT